MKTLSDREKLLRKAEGLKISLERDFKPPQVAWKLKNLWSSGYSTLGTLGNFSLVIGKAKSGKSFFINIAVSAALSKALIFKRYKSKLPKDQREVLYFDTEQGEYHVQLSLRRICKLTGIKRPANLHIYHLRKLRTIERLKIIEAVIEDNNKVGFVVIDGIRDLVTCINDELQATKITNKLLKWSEERNIHIVTVLHQNKGDHNARGHLGTELMNKAETVLSVTKTKGREGVSIVKPVVCRNKGPESFAFEIIDGLPNAVENYSEKALGRVKSKKLLGLGDEFKCQLLISAFAGAGEEGLMYGNLVEQIKEAYKEGFGESVGTNQVKQEFIPECRSKGWLQQEKPKGKYSLSLSLEHDP